MITENLKRAVAISEMNDQAVSYLRNRIETSYDQLTGGGDPQAVFDELGERAAVDVQCYGIALAALRQMDALRASIGLSPQATGLISPDPEIYQINENGTVTFIPPVESEIQ